MKLVSFEVPTPVGPIRRIGALVDESGSRIADLSAAYLAYLKDETDEPTPEGLAALRVPPDMIGWLRGADRSREAAEQALGYVRNHLAGTGAPAGTAGEQLVYDRSSVKLLAPVPRPNTLRDFSIFHEHMSKARPDPRPHPAHYYRRPPYYKGNPDEVLGPDDPFPYPAYTEQLDLELEIGIIVGKGGTNLSLDAARAAIAGYTIFIDCSARDRHAHELFGPGKSKDFGTTLGPYLVTAEEVDEGNLACRFLVDGELWWEGSTSEPRTFLAHHLVAYLSDHEMLHPGDVLGTGTVGMSCSMDTKRWIQVGQRARFEVEGLGVLEQEVVAMPGGVDYVLNGMDGLMRPPAA